MRALKWSCILNWILSEVPLLIFHCLYYFSLHIDELSTDSGYQTIQHELKRASNQVTTIHSH